MISIMFGFRKKLFSLRTISAFTMAAALMFPYLAKAVNIGELVMQSGVGEPFRAQVGLITGSGERIDDACLSLAAPDPRQDDVGTFLTEATLSLETEVARQYVSLSSPKPFNGGVNKLRLQIKCPGTRGTVKTLNIVPVLKPAGSQQSSLAAARNPSGKPGSAPSPGKISAEEFTLLLTEQKLLVDSLVSMQDQVKQLQGELGKVKLQLSQLGVSSVNAMPVTPAVAATAALTREDDSYRQNRLLTALGLVMAAVVLWLKLRSRRTVQTHNEIHSRKDVEPAQKPPADVVALPKWASSGIKQPSQVTRDDRHSILPQPNAGAARSVAASPPQAPLPKNDRPITDVDAMLEEAALYAANGRQAKAVEILLEVIKSDSSKADAWTLLLSLYSSLGKAKEFEHAARAFLKRHKDSPQWSGIQALGRTLDRDNPLYADQSGRVSAFSALTDDKVNLHRPIGDILMDMGVLSQPDMLKYLHEFDPEKHGRFGGYLVARKAITLAQLDMALLQQQGVHAEVKPGALPSLQEMENFIANFDPKQHGSVGKFMASLNAVTPEQLALLVQQQARYGAAASSTQPEAPYAIQQ